jgi:hypothetical protein
MGIARHFAWQQSSGTNVRFGQKQTSRHFQSIRFVPKADMAAISLAIFAAICPRPKQLGR